MPISGRTRLLGLEESVREAADWCLSVADFYRVNVDVTSGFRSRSEQAELRRRYERCVRLGLFGRTRECMFPANKPGFSAHEYGLAFDSVVAPELWSWWTRVRQAAGFHVLPADLPHAEAPNWRDFVRLPSGADD